ncbi:MAG TPA: hypothetical protein VMV59_06505 [Candidatus Dormibacteraeota bacterium]|nr:hypothetical protein [Candidatus Dormibacteraeota bacterium]
MATTDVKTPASDVDLDSRELDRLAGELDSRTRSRALARVLQHHSDLLAECDRLTARLGRCEKSLANTEARLSALEKLAQEPDAGKQPEQATESGAERKRAKQEPESRKGFLFGSR